jgi:hypothetical protein
VQRFSFAAERYPAELRALIREEGARPTSPLVRGMQASWMFDQTSSFGELNAFVAAMRDCDDHTYLRNQPPFGVSPMRLTEWAERLTWVGGLDHVEAKAWMWAAARLATRFPDVFEWEVGHDHGARTRTAPLHIPWIATEVTAINVALSSLKHDADAAFARCPRFMLAPTLAAAEEAIREAVPNARGMTLTLAAVDDDRLAPLLAMPPDDDRRVVRVRVGLERDGLRAARDVWAFILPTLNASSGG